MSSYCLTRGITKIGMFFDWLSIGIKAPLQVASRVTLLGFLAIFTASPVHAVGPGDSVPPIISAWWYTADTCIYNDNTALGIRTSESEMADATAKYSYGPNAEVIGTFIDWGTPEHKVYGFCSSSNLHPEWLFDINKMGIEIYNIKVFKVKYYPFGPNDPQETAVAVERHKTVACPPGTIDTQYQCIVGVVAYLPYDIPPPKSCSSPLAGNPIVVSNGSKFEQHEDIQSGVSGDLGFRLTYNNSDIQTTSPWRHNFQKNLNIIDPSKELKVRAKSRVYTTKESACLSGWSEMQRSIPDAWAYDTVAHLQGESCEIMNGSNKVVGHLYFAGQGATVPGSIQLSRDDGSVVSYEYFGGSDFRALGIHQGKLQMNGTDSWQFIAANGDIENYGADGKLLDITRSGKKQILTYNATTGILEKVTDSAGHQLRFAYLNNRVSSVTLDNAQVTSYHYNGVGLVDQVTHPNNTSRSYHYEDPRFPKALTGITDERGVRYATWKYDTQGRAISSEHAGGVEKTTLDFNADGTTTVTNVFGKKTKYLFEDVLGVKRVRTVTGEPTASCVGANQNYTYNKEGFIDTQTDWKGNITKFGYDGFGREILRTQAFNTPDAITTETCWHSSLNKPVRVIDAAKITLLEYWPNGQLKNQLTKPRPAGSTIACDTAL